MRILGLITVLILMGGLVACGNNSESQSNQTEDNTVKSVAKKLDFTGIVKPLPEPEPIKISYGLVSVQDTLHWLDSLPSNILRNILIINRLDKKYLARQDSIVIPDTLIEDVNVYCPFPRKIDSIKGINKIIYVSRWVQAFAAYENGVRVYWGPVSTGKSTTQTPNGLYSTNWKSKRNISSVNSSWVLNWYFNIHNYEGIAFHEYALPGIAASHGCVRMYGNDAKWMYDWADQWIMNPSQVVLAKGTPVIIFGQYPYNERKPWWQLPENGRALVYSKRQIMEATLPYWEKIIERQTTYLDENAKRELKKIASDTIVPVI